MAEAFLTGAFLAAGFTEGFAADFVAFTGAFTTTVLVVDLAAVDFADAGFAADFAGDLRATSFLPAALAASFLSWALDGNVSATPVLAALARRMLSSPVEVLGAALPLTGGASSDAAVAGLAAPSFNRTGLSPQSSSRL